MSGYVAVQVWFACRNKRYRQQRDGQGACPGCGWMTRLCSIWTRNAA